MRRSALLSHAAAFAVLRCTICARGASTDLLGGVPHKLDPPEDVWIHPALHVAGSIIAENGLFTSEPLDAGTVVVRLGGQLVTTDELRVLFAAAAASDEYVDTFAVGEDLHLVLPTHTSAHFGNHSCDPTMWPVSAFELATCRSIVAGEELTIDYGLISDDNEFRMACACGSAGCRGVITGADWRRADLQARYQGHWPLGLQLRIEGQGEPS